MMREECIAFGIPEPEFNVVTGGIDVVFRLPEKKEDFVSDKMSIDISNLTDAESTLYSLISEGVSVSVKEFSRTTGLSEKTVRGAIYKLVKQGYVKRIGGDKYGKWMPVSLTKR